MMLKGEKRVDNNVNIDNEKEEEKSRRRYKRKT